MKSFYTHWEDESHSGPEGFNLNSNIKESVNINKIETVVTRFHYIALIQVDWSILGSQQLSSPSPKTPRPSPTESEFKKPNKIEKG